MIQQSLCVRRASRGDARSPVKRLTHLAVHGERLADPNGLSLAREFTTNRPDILPLPASVAISVLFLRAFPPPLGLERTISVSASPVSDDAIDSMSANGCV